MIIELQLWDLGSLWETGVEAGEGWLALWLHASLLSSSSWLLLSYWSHRHHDNVSKARYALTDLKCREVLKNTYTLKKHLLWPLGFFQVGHADIQQLH